MWDNRDLGIGMSKRTTLFKLGLCALAFWLAAAGLAPDAGNRNAGPDDVLRVGLLEDSPPYDFYNDRNHLVGLNIDLVHEAGRRMHRRVEIRVIPYNRVVMGLLYGHYDVIAAPQSVNPYRGSVVRFLDPYLQSGDVIVYHPGMPAVESLEDVKSRGLKIAAFNGTSYPRFLDGQGLSGQMVVYPTQREMFMAFLNGKVDVMLMDEHIARYYRDREHFPFRLSRATVRSEKSMAFSVRKDSRLLGDALEATMHDMARDGTLAAIETRWLGKDIAGGQARRSVMALAPETEVAR